MGEKIFVCISTFDSSVKCMDFNSWSCSWELLVRPLFLWIPSTPEGKQTCCNPGSLVFIVGPERKKQTMFGLNKKWAHAHVNCKMLQLTLCVSDHLNPVLTFMHKLQLSFFISFIVLCQMRGVPTTGNHLLYSIYQEIHSSFISIPCHSPKQNTHLLKMLLFTRTSNAPGRRICFK